MNTRKSIREWEEPETPEPFEIKKGLSYFLNADEDEFDVDEALVFLKDMKIELAIYYARIEALQKLEKKIKEAIRATGEIPEVEGIIVKFGKPSTRNYAYLKKLVESAEKDNMGETIERLAELHSHLRTKKAQKLLLEITQEFAERYMPLSSFFYEKDISPRITIKV